MTDQIEILGQLAEHQLLTTEDLATLLKTSTRNLIAWRQARVGPPYVVMSSSSGKRGGIRYRPTDVSDWLTTHTTKRGNNNEISNL